MLVRRGQLRMLVSEDLVSIGLLWGIAGSRVNPRFASASAGCCRKLWSVAGVSVCYGKLRGILGSCGELRRGVGREVTGEYGRLWGGFWQVSVGCVRPWLFVVGYGELRGVTGNFCRVLGVTGRRGELWGVVESFWDRWGVMASCGELWKSAGVIGSCGQLWGVAVRCCKFWQVAGRCGAMRGVAVSYGELW